MAEAVHEGRATGGPDRADMLVERLAIAAAVPLGALARLRR